MTENMRAYAQAKKGVNMTEHMRAYLAKGNGYPDLRLNVMCTRLNVRTDAPAVNSVYSV